MTGNVVRTPTIILVMLLFLMIPQPGRQLITPTVDSRTGSSLTANDAPTAQSGRQIPTSIRTISFAGTVDVKNLPPLEVPSSTAPFPRPMSRPYVSALLQTPAAPAPTGTVSSSSLQTFIGFRGMDQRGSEALGCPLPCFPPDVQVASGPNHVVEVVNTAMAIFSKQGVSIQNSSLSHFFGDNRASRAMFDTKILYDAFNATWFASTIDGSLGNLTDSSLRLAVSTSSDPTGRWNIFELAAPGVDQPLLGVANDKIVVSGNFFGGTTVWVIRKADLLAGVRSPLVNTSSSLPFVSVYPVHSLSATTTEYMVSTCLGGGFGCSPNNSRLTLFSVTGVPPAAKVLIIANFTIPALTTPPPAPGEGDSLVDTADTRTLDAVWSNGRLWLGADTNSTPRGDTQPRSGIRLIQIDTTMSAIKQDFDLNANGFYYFYPAFKMDNAGNLDMIFGYSSNTNSTCCYPSLAITGQGVDDPANSLAQPMTIVAGSAPDQTNQPFAGPRYGDYFGAGVDPSDPTQVWVAGEYHSSSTGICPTPQSLFLQGGTTGPCWSTFISSMRVVRDFRIASNPSTFASAAGSTVNSNITLTSVNGFAGTIGLSAGISPTVTSEPSVTLSPASLTLAFEGSATSKLTVSTASTTPSGLYTITVTGTSGSLSHSTTFALAITPITFSISNTTTFTGVTVKTTGTLTLNSPSTTFTASGTATVVATNSSTGSALFSKTYTITGLRFIPGSSGGFLAEFLLNVPVSPYRLSSDVTINFSGAGTSSSVRVTRNIDINADGIVNQADANIISAAFQCSIGSTCYNAQADLNADGIVNIFDLYLYGQYSGATDYT